MILPPMTRMHFITPLLTVAGLLACEHTSVAVQPPIVTPQLKIQSRQPRSFQSPQPDSTTEQADRSDKEDGWFLIQYEGATIGYETLMTTVAAVGSVDADTIQAGDATPIVHRSRDTRLRLKRFGNDLSVSAHLETIESTDGLLYSWSLRRTAADGSVILRSAVWNVERQAYLINSNDIDNKKLEILSSRVQPRSPILPEWLSVPELDRPRQWSSAILFPETSAIVDIEIRRLPPQSIRLQDGKTITATRHDYWPTNQPDLRSSVYYDDHGEVVLVEQPLLGKTLRFYRTDAASALGEENLKSLDLQFLTSLPLRRPLLNSERSNEVRMMISVGPAEQISLPSGDFQAIEQTTANSLIVTLTRPSEEPEGVLITRPPARITSVDRKFRESSRWINSADDTVRRMAVFAGGAVTDPLEKCGRLSSYLQAHLRISAFSTSMLPASEVVKSKQGDCTEFSVLLAALIRSEGIPSRVAVGFVYVPNPASFVPHMWTEAWIDGAWIPFDATLGGKVNPMTRFKVTDSALPDSVKNGTVLFVPLLNFLGRATVEILPESQR